MGCDMHLHVEVKIEGEWHHYSRPEVFNAVNAFYAFMGSERGFDFDIKPMIAPRGMPKDATAITKLMESDWEGDSYSHSYVMGDELAELDKCWNRIAEDLKREFPEEGEPTDKRYDIEADILQCNHAFIHRYTHPLLEEERKHFPFDLAIEDVRWVYWFVG